MAQQGGKGGGARKIGSNKRSPSGASQKIRTTNNKRRRVERQEAMMARPLSEVSLNCVKNRAKRGDRKAKDYLKTKPFR